jgi:hypothetical protein
MQAERGKQHLKFNTVPSMCSVKVETRRISVRGSNQWFHNVTAPRSFFPKTAAIYSTQHSVLCLRIYETFLTRCLGRWVFPSGTLADRFAGNCVFSPFQRTTAPRSVEKRAESQIAENILSPYLRQGVHGHACTVRYTPVTAGYSEPGRSA